MVDAAPVRALFKLSEDERLLGWVNLGPPGSPSKKPRGEDGPVDLGALVTLVGEDDRPFGSGT